MTQQRMFRNFSSVRAYAGILDCVWLISDVAATLLVCTFHGANKNNFFQQKLFFLFPCYHFPPVVRTTVGFINHTLLTIP